jgi:hypothetical protein
VGEELRIGDTVVRKEAKVLPLSQVVVRYTSAYIHAHMHNPHKFINVGMFWERQMSNSEPQFQLRTEERVEGARVKRNL